MKLYVLLTKQLHYTKLWTECKEINNMLLNKYQYIFMLIGITQLRICHKQLRGDRRKCRRTALERV